MADEEIIENGIVISSKNGIAQVALIKNDNCEECTAKIFCNPSAADDKVLEAIDTIGAKSGDSVKIVVKGKSILVATILLYFVPLILLVAGIVVGTLYFGNSKNNEIYSFLVGFILMGVYFVFIYLFSSKMDLKARMPKITHSVNSF